MPREGFLCFNTSGGFFCGLLERIAIIIAVLVGSFLLLLLYILVSIPDNSQENSDLQVLPKSDSGSSLIKFDTKQKESYQVFTKQLESWFNNIPEDYDSNVRECSFGATAINEHENSSCAVDKEQFHECSVEKHFGYPKGVPCILISFKKINDWRPEGFGLNGKQFNSTVFDSIFDDEMQDLENRVTNNPGQEFRVMPQFLQDYIKETVSLQHSVQWKTNFLNSVFITCEGKTPTDKEHIGRLVFEPYLFIPSYYFPFRGQSDYQPPFVMVQLRRLKVGVLINVECRAWTKNIQHDSHGVVHFEVMMDEAS